MEKQKKNNIYEGKGIPASFLFIYDTMKKYILNQKHIRFDLYLCLITTIVYNNSVYQQYVNKVKTLDIDVILPDQSYSMEKWDTIFYRYGYRYHISILYDIILLNYCYCCDDEVFIS